MFPRQAPHAFAFGPQHPCHGIRKIGRKQIVPGAFVGADDPDTALLELAERTREIGYRKVGHRLGGSAGHLARAGSQPDGTILRRDYGTHSRCVGDTQAGAEIVRILNTVEHQQQRRSHDCVQSVVKTVAALNLRNARRDALMARVAGQAIEALAGSRHHSHLLLLRELQQVAHAAVGSLCAGVQFQHAFRPLAQQDGNRVEPEHDACLVHFSTGTRSILRVSRSTRTSFTRMRSASR